MLTREFVTDLVRRTVSAENLRSLEFNGAATGQGYVYESSDRVWFDSRACHSYLSDLRLKDLKDHALVNPLFFYSKCTKGLEPRLIPIIKNHILSDTSMFKDIVKFVTLVEHEDPYLTCFFALNDTEADFTPYEKSLLINFFIFMRMFTEYTHVAYIKDVIESVESGILNFEEASIFMRAKHYNNTLPSYDTHWAFNGGITKAARFLFRLGPNKEGHLASHGLTVNNRLWQIEGLPEVYWNPQAKTGKSKITGMLSTYEFDSKFTYEPQKSDSFEDKLRSIKSFIDAYKQEYVK